MLRGMGFAGGSDEGRGSVGDSSFDDPAVEKQAAAAFLQTVSETGLTEVAAKLAWRIMETRSTNPRYVCVQCTLLPRPFSPAFADTRGGMPLAVAEAQERQPASILRALAKDLPSSKFARLSKP